MGFLDSVASTVGEQMTKTEGATQNASSSAGGFQDQLMGMFKEHMASKDTSKDDTTEDEKNDAVAKVTEFLKEKMGGSGGEEPSATEKAGIMAKVSSFLQSSDFKDAKVKDLPAKLKSFFSSGDSASTGNDSTGGLASMAKSFF